MELEKISRPTVPDSMSGFLNSLFSLPLQYLKVL